MSSVLSGAHLGLSASRILMVICLVLAGFAVGAVPEATASVASNADALKVGPIRVGSNFLLESCANDSNTVDQGGCDEDSRSNLGGYSGATNATDGTKHSAAHLTVSVVPIPAGLLVTAKGSGGISSSAGTNSGSADTQTDFSIDIAVGDEPVGVAVSGTIDVSGGPCTSSPATVDVTIGDGSTTSATCPGGGQTVSAQYVAGAGTTITVGAQGHVELFDQAATASVSFDLEFALGCTHAGTNGPDVLTGTPGDDTLCGFDGDDTLRGLGGNDFLLGAEGEDVLLGGPGDDNLDAGPGAEADLVFGGPGDDLLFEGAWMFGGSGNDTLQGGARGALMYGCGGADGMFGEGGDDYLAVYQAPGVSDQDVLDALGITGTPLDVACKSSPQPDGKDTITGDGGDDHIFGGGGRDKINGGAAIDTIHGQGDRDTITGGRGRDKLFGDGDNDTILAKDTVRDLVRGGPGFDRAKRDRGKDDVAGIEAFI
ncbi:hypothetical protein ISU10_03770 [Nocardioides agariphilus]|jgi:Ca2+-binding RTX toxin-like protein|uniref:Hemolysin-type calcium-binding repeat-containing protein n=1 Tax=Nocardioides agariphilus TaxID=433664 RepID=A0A930VN43_9ACTN|nr:calcium-binding protein [Nocardioides agariphilus]MBF4766885.1 hypothetical protein [Nocardioides agariphilus]